MNQKVYMWIGTFAVVMMVYLFVAPKLVKKPGGAPPRAGSNAEQMAVAQVEAGMTPGAMTGGGQPYMLPSIGGQGFRVWPEGGRGPAQPGLSFGGRSPAAFKIGQAYRSRRRRAFRGRRRRALRGFKPRNPRMNLFPFANVTMA